MPFQYHKISRCKLGLIWVLLLFMGAACQSPPSMLQIRGKTMGTTYSILYVDSLNRDFSESIDALLEAYNQELSTYIPDSRISQFNQSEQGIEFPLSEAKHLLRNYKLAAKVYGYTEGWFNPAVMPLVNYWGFGYTEKKAVEQVDSSLIDSLKNLANFDAFSLIEKENSIVLNKAAAGMQLDFSAVAKGDAVDQVGKLLEKEGVQNYMVEIGGEVRARGNSLQQQAWLIGISNPQSQNVQELQRAVALKNRSLATSGNYRNFYEVNGVKYAHTINPHTGYPEKNRLLSVSVFSADCALADALATGFMAMGLEGALRIVRNIPEAEAYFIYSDASGKLQVAYTDAVKDFFVEMEQDEVQQN